jgi:hypothetical protein
MVIVFVNVNEDLDFVVDNLHLIVGNLDYVIDFYNREKKPTSNIYYQR